MAYINTSNGIIKYKRHLLYLGEHYISKTILMENLVLLAKHLDGIGINWGPAFGTLIGIVRNNDVMPLANVFNIYVLREDEERFKDVLRNLFNDGFSLVRYERRGLYYIARKNEYFKIFILHKISYDIRHTGGSDFIHEKFLQNVSKWDFNGVMLNVPEDLDEYLTFQYGDWVKPVEKDNKLDLIHRYLYWAKIWVQDKLPDFIYYKWLKLHRAKDFNRFKTLCKTNGCPLPKNIELSNMRPRNYRRILTVGVYDLIHRGHAELYRRAKALGDYLIVAVQDDEYIKKYKPESRVMNSTEDRMFMVKSIRYVDKTVVYTDVDKIVKEIDFDIFITGPDQNHAGFQRAIKWCEENGREHIVLGRTQGISSSELKAKIAMKSGNSMN